MIDNVKSNRLHAHGWLVAVALGGLAINANSAEVPVPQGSQILEYQRVGNTYTWTPVGASTPPGSGSISFPSTSTISDVSPKVTSVGSLPYNHKGGEGAKVTISTAVDRGKLAAGVSALAAAAAAGQIRPGHPLVMSAQIAGAVFGPFLISDFIEAGIQKLSTNDNGDLIAEKLSDTQHPVSNGLEYYHPDAPQHGYAEKSAACQHVNTYPPEGYYVYTPPFYNIYQQRCYATYARTGGGYSYSVDLGPPYARQDPDCPSGSPIVNGVCTPGAEPLMDEVPFSDFVEQAIDKPWSPLHASLLAGVIKAGHNVYTDGTGSTITGPESVPLSTETSTWPVNVLPGTTTVAPVGHTGPTDSGRVSTVVETIAKNTYSSGSSSGGSSGSSSGSGPSMTTTQQTKTTTTITNITNNITETNVTNITEVDKSPDEKETKEQKPFCEENPESLACAELDTPDGEIPSGQLNINYEYSDIFGNGSCPADYYLNTHGQNLKVWDWQNTCDKVRDYFKPVLLACCAFIAFVIVSAGGKE